MSETVLGGGRRCFHACLTDEKTEVQRGEDLRVISQKWIVADSGSKGLSCDVCLTEQVSKPLLGTLGLHGTQSDNHK